MKHSTPARKPVRADAAQTELPLNLEPPDRFGSLLSRSDGDVHELLAELDWDFESVRTDDFTHGLHSYPAKFIPQLPARLIQALSDPGDLVVDPFSGGGTTGVEALRLGRQFLGLDANPVGVLLGEVKTTPLSAPDRSVLDNLEATLEGRDWNNAGALSDYVPAIPNIDKWYSPPVVAALSHIRAEIEALPAGPARSLARAALANTAAAVSFQESETRYVSKPREVAASDAPSRFVTELRRMVSRVSALDSVVEQGQVRFCLGDARRRENFAVESGGAGLVVTSPPYPNAYDYHLYHRFRLFWLGADPADLRRVEIGSHLKHQAETDPAFSFESDMTAVLANLLDLVEPGRYCVMVVGDGIYNGEPYRTAERLKAIALDGGWTAHPPIARMLPETRRSVTSAGRRLRTEEVLVLRKPSPVVRLRAIEPSYERFPYEVDLARRELRVLTGLESESDDCLDTSPQNAETIIRRASNAAFWHGVDNGISTTPTLQRLLEDPCSGRRKHSTYVTHGLHRYKGKFYPQLAKALLNLSNDDSTVALALDPFGGSGTVMLEAVLSGKNAISIDCSPLATAVARSKVAVLSVSPCDLARESTGLLASLPSSGPKVIASWEPFAETTCEELAAWFAPGVLAKLGALLDAVRAVKDPRLVAFYEVIVSDLIREVSHQDPRDLRIRRRADPLDDAPVMELFRTRAEGAIAKVMAFHAICLEARPELGTGHAVLGNSAEENAFGVLDSPNGSIDAVVSSPPYATALPYLDTDRLSLAAVFGYDKRQRNVLEKRLIGSRETSRSEQRAVETLIDNGLQGELPDSTSTFLQQLLEVTTSDATAGFRRQQLPTVLTKYFLGVSAVLRQLAPRMTPGAHLWFVLGDSRTQVGGRRWVIPTVDEFLSIAKHVGFDYIEKIPITVTREDVIHARHTITENAILHLRAPD